MVNVVFEGPEFYVLRLPDEPIMQIDKDSTSATLIVSSSDPAQPKTTEPNGIGSTNVQIAVRIMRRRKLPKMLRSHRPRLPPYRWGNQIRRRTPPCELRLFQPEIVY